MICPTPLFVLIPLGACALVLILPRYLESWIRRLALTATTLNLALALYVFIAYDPARGGYEWEILVPWIQSLGISYHAGIDGLSAFLLLLAGLVSFSAAFVSFSIRERVKEYFVFFLILVTSVFGVFTSLDLFFLYFFFEMAVIPMFPLIGIWGSKNGAPRAGPRYFSITRGAESPSPPKATKGFSPCEALAQQGSEAILLRRGLNGTASQNYPPSRTHPRLKAGSFAKEDKEYAAFKLTLYISTGAVVALVGILALTAFFGNTTFDLVLLQKQAALNPLPAAFQKWCFPLLLFGFGVIASLWPTHSWSPIGYAAAPSAVSMMHAGVLKKLGAYLILRVALPLFPEGVRLWFPVISVLATVNILYAGLAAMAQRDLKFLIGFSSVSHMGYVFLGILSANAIGLTGAVFYMFSHGLMAASAFALIGFLYDQTHTREIPDLGGLARRLPFVGTLFVMTALASSGLPGFSNFLAELLVLIALWRKAPWLTLLAALGIIITAVYLLRAVAKGFFGPLPKRWENLRDVRGIARKIPYAILIAALLVFGFFPQIAIQKMKPAVEEIVLLQK